LGGAGFFFRKLLTLSCGTVRDGFRKIVSGCEPIRADLPECPSRITPEEDHVCRHPDRLSGGEVPANDPFQRQALEIAWRIAVRNQRIRMNRSNPSLAQHPPRAHLHRHPVIVSACHLQGFHLRTNPSIRKA
jgi:hypothetical protein